MSCYCEVLLVVLQLCWYQCCHVFHVSLKTSRITVEMSLVSCVFFPFEMQTADRASSHHHHLLFVLFPWKLCWHDDVISKQRDGSYSSYLSSVPLISSTSYRISCDTKQETGSYCSASLEGGRQTVRFTFITKLWFKLREDSYSRKHWRPEVVK